MAIKSSTLGEHRVSRKVVIVLAVIAFVTTAAYGTAIAKESSTEAFDERYVSRSVQPGGSRSAELIRVPSGKQLLITQACQESPAMYVVVGERGNRISFNGNGCTHFRPGYLVAGGTSIYCVNKSAQARACVLMGKLQASEKASPGAKFYDVSEELSK